MDPHVGKTQDEESGSGEPQPGPPCRTAGSVGSSACGPQGILGASPAAHQPAGCECHHDGDEGRVYGHALSIGYRLRRIRLIGATLLSWRARRGDPCPCTHLRNPTGRDRAGPGGLDVLATGALTAEAHPAGRACRLHLVNGQR